MSKPSVKSGKRYHISLNPGSSDGCECIFVKVDFQISNSMPELIYRGSKPTESNPYLKRIGERGTQLVKSIFRLHGITRILIEPYEMTITIAENFDRDKKKEKIIDILVNNSPNKNKVTILDRIEEMKDKDTVGIVNCVSKIMNINWSKSKGVILFRITPFKLT